MAKGDYMPKSDVEFVNWHDRFKVAATSIGTTLGIAADDLTEIGTDNPGIHETCRDHCARNHSVVARCSR
jgi:hypothetical protein